MQLCFYIWDKRCRSSRAANQLGLPRAVSRPIANVMKFVEPKVPPGRSGTIAEFVVGKLESALGPLGALFASDLGALAHTSYFLHILRAPFVFRFVLRAPLCSMARIGP